MTKPADAAKSEIQFFLPIQKVDAKKRMVWGYASTATVDLDGEVVATKAIQAALPNYMKWRNIREMHEPSAVGVTKEANVDDKGLYIGAHIRDDDAWAKCQPDKDGHAVYSGFSIGGRKVRKAGNTITELELVEISLVDRPANPECRIDVVKIAKPLEAGESAEDTDQPPLPAFLTEGAGADDIVIKGEEASLLRKLLTAVGLGKIAPVEAEQSDDEWVAAQLLTASEDYAIDDITMAASAVAITKLAGPEGSPGGTLWKMHIGNDVLKREFSSKEREAAASSGAAMPDGSFPIKNKDDLKNAVRAYGRAKNKAKAKAHIIARAHALKCTDCLPDGWVNKPKAATTDEPNTTTAINAIDADAVLKFLNGEELPADVRDTIEKGLYATQGLCQAFEAIRGAQRSMISEGVAENDDGDGAIAARLGLIAKELASIIAEKAEHEGAEAVDLTDADDRWVRQLIEQSAKAGEVDMTKAALTPDQVKAVAAAARDGIIKGLTCMTKAKGAFASGVKSLMIAQACLAAATVKDAAGKEAKLDPKDAPGHITKALEFFAIQSDQADLAELAIAKVAGTWGAGSGLPGSVAGMISSIGQSEMTEGSVAEYSATEPYPGKGANIDQATMDRIIAAETKAAKLEGAAEATTALLKSLPAGAPRAHLFSVPDKQAFQLGGEDGTEGNDAMALLTKGINVDRNDPDSVTRACGLMLGNQVMATIKGQHAFGKSVMSPDFHGSATGGR